MRRLALPLTLLALLGLEMFNGLPSALLSSVFQTLATMPQWFYGFLALMFLAPVVSVGVGWGLLVRRRRTAAKRSRERG